MVKAFMNDTILLQALKKHDVEAFEFLYENSRVWLFGLAYSETKDEVASQDIVSDFFMDFWEQRLYQKIDTSLKGYLFQSIRNRAQNYVKKRSYQNNLKAELPHPFENFYPSNKLEQDQLQQSIQAALQKVPPAAAEIFRLHYMMGLSHSEIADKQGISTHTVRNQISKALRILRLELKNIANE